MIQIHILVDQVHEVVAVGAGRITQVYYGYLVAVALCNIAAVAHDVAFRVRGEKAPAGASILDAWVQPKGSFADAGRADHQHVDIAGVYHRCGVSCASNDDALRKRFSILTGRCFSGLCLLTPLLWCKWNVFINLSLLAFGHPSGGSVLTVANRPGFDIVEAVHIRQQCDPAEDAEHDSSDDDQSRNT